jgi:site-specific DNA-methyltransferase (adenine-specific)
MPQIKDESIDLILTDPPFNATWCEWDKQINFEKMWLHFNRIIKPKGAMLVFGMEPFSSYLRMANIEFYRYDIIWDKLSTSNFANAKKMPLNVYENISVFYKKQPTYNPIMTKALPHKVRPLYDPVMNMSDTNQIYSGITKKYSDNYDNTKRYPTKIIRISSREKECNSHSRMHPAQKPLSLCNYLISTFSNDGDLVFDGFMGVGSVCLSAALLNRRYIGIELNRGYYLKAKARLIDEL